MRKERKVCYGYGSVEVEEEREKFVSWLFSFRGRRRESSKAFASIYRVRVMKTFKLYAWKGRVSLRSWLVLWLHLGVKFML